MVCKRERLHSWTDIWHLKQSCWWLCIGYTKMRPVKLTCTKLKKQYIPIVKEKWTFTLVQQRSVVSRLFELATHPPNCTIYLLYLLRLPTWYFRLRDASKSNLHHQVITSHFTRRKTTYTSVWILQRLVNAITLHRKRTEIKVSLAPKFAYSVVPIGNFISACCRRRTSQITLFRT